MSIPKLEQNDEAQARAKANALLQRAISEAFTLLEAGAAQEAIAHVRHYGDLAARSDVGCYVFGLIYFNADDLRSSLRWFDRAVSLNPAYVEALSARAIVLQRLGQPLDALDTFETLLLSRPNDADIMFSIGVILQSVGRMKDALGAYEGALRVRPEHCEALTNRGALLERFGRLDEALTCFSDIAKIRPDDSRTLFNKGSVLQKLGRREEALAAYEQAAACGPPDAENELNRGNVLQNLGRLEEAVLCYDRALQYRAGYQQAHYNRGIALQALGLRDEALRAYDSALAIDPCYCEASCNRGNILHEQGRLEEALAAYNAALKIRPGFLPALANKASVLLQRGRAEQALLTCDEALRHDPDHPQTLGIRGAALQRLGRLNESLAALDRALQLNPGAPEAWLNRGNVMQELDRHPEAVAAYDEALRLRPNYPEALSSVGVVLKEAGDIDRALTYFDAALRHKPDYADARNNRAGALLLKGDLKAGFEDFESRWDRSNAPPRTLVSSSPHWQGPHIEGHRIEGRSIVVWDEQGLGDLIQFSRYLVCLAEAGADVAVHCRKNMRRLLGSLPARVRFVDAAGKEETFAFQSALLSLPHSFQTGLNTVPSRTPYLHAEPDLVSKWSDRMGGAGFRIGICWRGNAFINLKRSIPPRCFAPIAAIPGVRLISLMIDQGADGPCPAELPFAVESLGEDFDVGPDSFVDCAAAMANLDLIITSDTAIAHLAGALGRPVFVALKRIPDWRWLLGRGDSPWYPTMRLFRQSEKDGWEEVFDAITACVESLAGSALILNKVGAAQISIPAAIGELIDKITILEIKESHVTDAQKLANIRHELGLLRKLATEAGFEREKLADIKADLKAANAMLWDIENALREHESRADFGDGFVALARQVYKSNDWRASLKKKINLKFNSAIVEEKYYPAKQRS